MHIFYTPDIGETENYTFSAEESKHSLKVLRLKKNDELQLIDGKGNLFYAKITDVTSGRCSVSIEKKIAGFNKRNYYIHIAIAPTKNIDRFEWFVEKSTEIGIDEITPLLCSHSERKTIKSERLERVVISAMKQSVIAKKPVLNEMTTFAEFIESSGNMNGMKLIAHCSEGERKNPSDVYHPGLNALILIGPEGDFTTDEIQLALKSSFSPVTLGINRLRTETAGVVACHTISILNE